jgi:anti-anti-sigma factor
MTDADASKILYACPSDDCVVFRVVGRGGFQNSVALKQTAEKMMARNNGTRFVFDLGGCVSMDSTFMGVLASLGLQQRRRLSENLAIINASEHTRRLLETLGLAHFLDVRSDRADLGVSADAYASAGQTKIDRREQIIHMIQAHEELINLDSRNRVRFDDVVKVLSESLGDTDGQGR